MVNDTKAETPVLWPPHAKSWLIGKDSDAGRDWGQEKKGTTEDEMDGWHHSMDVSLSELWDLVMDREAHPGIYWKWPNKLSLSLGDYGSIDCQRIKHTFTNGTRMFNNAPDLRTLAILSLSSIFTLMENAVFHISYKLQELLRKK